MFEPEEVTTLVLLLDGDVARVLAQPLDHLHARFQALLASTETLLVVLGL